MTERRHKHSRPAPAGRPVLALWFGTVACIAAAMALIAFADPREPPRSPSRSAWPDAVTVRLNGQPYRIPTPYFQIIKAPGDARAVSLAFTWHDAQPVPRRRGGPRPDGYVSLLGNGRSIVEPETLIYRFFQDQRRFEQAVGPLEERQYGLLVFEGQRVSPLRPPPGETYWSGRQQLFTDAIDETISFYMNCWAVDAVPNPQCQMHFLHSGVRWEVYFSRDNLPHWQGVRQAITDLLDGFVLSAAQDTSP